MPHAWRGDGTHPACACVMGSAVVLRSTSFRVFMFTVASCLWAALLQQKEQARQRVINNFFLLYLLVCVLTVVVGFCVAPQIHQRRSAYSSGTENRVGFLYRRNDGDCLLQAVVKY